jgi:hypothetical protein
MAAPLTTLQQSCNTDVQGDTELHPLGEVMRKVQYQCAPDGLRACRRAARRSGSSNTCQESPGIDGQSAHGIHLRHDRRAD